MSYNQKHPYIRQLGQIFAWWIKDSLQRLAHWIRPGKNCRASCLSCGFFNICKADTEANNGKKRHHPHD